MQNIHEMDNIVHVWNMPIHNFGFLTFFSFYISFLEENLDYSHLIFCA
jgi:hypothetical protein